MEEGKLATHILDQRVAEPSVDCKAAAATESENCKDDDSYYNNLPEESLDKKEISSLVTVILLMKGKKGSQWML